MAETVQPVAPVAPAVVVTALPMHCFVASSGGWKPGTALSVGFVGSMGVYIVVLPDGSSVQAKLSDVRLGTTAPTTALGTLPLNAAGKRLHTMIERHGEWLVASPDGILIKSHATEKEAAAHLKTLLEPTVKVA